MDKQLEDWARDLVKMHKGVKDIQGKRFGQLVVISYSGKVRDGSKWLCRCDCGAEVVRNRKTFMDAIRKGNTSRCSRNCPKKTYLPNMNTYQALGE